MVTQNRGIIRLLPKPKKKEELKKSKTGDQYTLLNVDYKIGSKALVLQFNLCKYLVV